MAIRRGPGQESAGSGAFDEYDTALGKPKRVTYATRFTGWKPEECMVLVTVASMTSEQVRQKVQAGPIDAEAFEKRIQDTMEKVREAMEAMSRGRQR